MFLFLVTFSMMVGAEVILSQPSSIYNLGDTIPITATVASSVSANGYYQMYLICAGSEKEFYRQYLVLTPGDEKTMDAIILLNDDTMGSAGTCKIKGKFNDQYSLTQEFAVSDKTTITASLEKEVYNPEEGVIVKGSAIKENSQAVNGFVEVKIPEKQISVSGIVNDGSFLLNFSFPKNTKSQIYTVDVEVYEKDSSGKKINSGTTQLALTINQIPTTLEIEIPKSEIDPGDTLTFTPKLFDQAGDVMRTSGVYTIKDPTDKIMEQLKGDTGLEQSYYIKNGSKAGQWKIFSVAYKNTAEKTFKVLEREEAYMELRNTTLYVKNTGNVPYTKTILVKLGEESKNIETNLAVGEDKEYNLNKLGAAGGSYDVKISDGDRELSGNIFLTGKAIASDSNSEKNTTNTTERTMVQSPWLWLVIVLLAGVIGALIIHQKKKNKFGKEDKKDDVKTKKGAVLLQGQQLDFSTGKIKRAEYSPTIKGESQTGIVVCLKLKNYADIVRSKEGIKDTMNEINTFADASKAVLYENNEFMFYMLVPNVTKTVKNGKTALNIAEEIHRSIEKHNKFFKQKIEYGVSLNLGELISKVEKDILKFTAIGDFLTSSKKISEVSHGEPLLSEKLRAKVMADVKTEKVERGNVTAYRITQIVNRDENKKFIGEFVKRNDNKKPRWQA